MTVSRTKLHKGMGVLIDGEQYQVDRVNMQLRNVRLEGQAGQDRTYPIDDFKKQIVRGNVVVLFTGGRGNASGEVASNILALLPETHRLGSLKRLAVARKVLTLKKANLCWDQIIKDLHQQGVVVEGQRVQVTENKRVIQYWLKDYSQHGVWGVLVRRGNCGRTTRVSELFRETARGIIECEFLTHETMSVGALMILVKDAYEKACKEQDVDPGIRGIGALMSVLRSYSYDQRVLKRLDPRTAAALRRKAIKHHKDYQLFERHECDSTKLDHFCLYRSPLGSLLRLRPWVTVIMNAAVGFPPIIFISPFSPTAQAISEAIRTALLPREDAFFDKHGIKNRIQVYGRWKELDLDQGPENAGSPIFQNLEQLGMVVHWGMPGKPEKRPFVERFHKELNEFLRNFKGSTNTALRKGEKRTEQAMKEACINFEDLETLINRWAYDVYAQKPIERLSYRFGAPTSPAQAIANLRDQLDLDIPFSEDEIYRASLLRAGRKRKAHRDGLPFMGQKYHSQDLHEFVLEHGPGTLVHVFYDPLDVRVIAIAKNLDDPFIYLQCKRPLPAIGFDELRAFNKRIKGTDADKKEADANFAEIIAIARDMEAKPRKFSKSKSKDGAKQTEKLNKLKQEERTKKVLEETKQQPAMLRNAPSSGAARASGPSFVDLKSLGDAEAAPVRGEDE